MKRIALTAVAVALALGVAFDSEATADKNEESRLTAVQEAPAADKLTVKTGSAEGHKSPLEVVEKALTAAKADELAKLKACFISDDHDNLDNESWDSRDEKITNLQHIAKLLKTYDSEKLNQLSQNSVGNYAVVVCTVGEKLHVIKTVLESPEDSESEGEAPANWYLAEYRPYQYRIDYNTSDVKAIRDAISKGDVDKLKEFLNEWQTETLDLLEGVQEGADPYDLLLKRLQKIVNNGERPEFLFSRSMNSLAYRFSSEAGATYFVLTFNEEYDWEDDSRNTRAEIALDSIARFHKDAPQEFKNFVSDWDWG